MNKEIALSHHPINQKKNTTNSLFQLSLITSALLFSGYAVAYSEVGQLGNKQSWESPEYQKDWGLAAMNASSAYALGFHGQGAKVGGDGLWCTALTSRVEWISFSCSKSQR